MTAQESGGFQNGFIVLLYGADKNWTHQNTGNWLLTLLPGYRMISGVLVLFRILSGYLVRIPYDRRN